MNVIAPISVRLFSRILTLLRSSSLGRVHALLLIGSVKKRTQFKLHEILDCEIYRMLNALADYAD